MRKFAPHDSQLKFNGTDSWGVFIPTPTLLFLFAHCMLYFFSTYRIAPQLLPVPLQATAIVTYLTATWTAALPAHLLMRGRPMVSLLKCHYNTHCVILYIDLTLSLQYCFVNETVQMKENAVYILRIINIFLRPDEYLTWANIYLLI